MTAPFDPLDPDGDVLVLAVPYALHAMTDDERDATDARVFESGVAPAFYDEVRAVRETMAMISAATAIEPPPALRDQILAAATSDKTMPDNVRTLPGATPRRRRWQQLVLAAAAAVVIGLGAVGIGMSMRSAEQPSPAQEIFAAPDVRTVSGELPAGGQATLVFSRERDKAFLVMNNVPPPSEGTVYQMWLFHDGQATSAGTMDAASVSPSTTAVVPDIGDSTELAFTVEPGTGSTRPTGDVFATLPLT